MGYTAALKPWAPGFDSEFGSLRGVCFYSRAFNIHDQIILAAQCVNINQFIDVEPMYAFESSKLSEPFKKFSTVTKRNSKATLQSYTI